MSTVVLGEQPFITDWLAQRAALGQDRFDEVWDGTYHVAPNARVEHGIVAVQVLMACESAARAAGLTSIGPFNLGLHKTDFRVPDGGWLAEPVSALYLPTAVAVLEVLSPDDETFAKLDFYAERGVEEVLVAHPTERWVQCWRLEHGTTAREASTSRALGLSMDVLTADVRWPV